MNKETEYKIGDYYRFTSPTHDYIIQVKGDSYRTYKDELIIKGTLICSLNGKGGGYGDEYLIELFEKADYIKSRLWKVLND